MLQESSSWLLSDQPRRHQEGHEFYLTMVRVRVDDHSSKMRRERMITRIIGFPSMLHCIHSNFAALKVPYLATKLTIAFDEFDV
jgi:hypothetical protein